MQTDDYQVFSAENTWCRKISVLQFFFFNPKMFCRFLSPFPTICCCSPPHSAWVSSWLWCSEKWAWVRVTDWLFLVTAFQQHVGNRRNMNYLETRKRFNLGENSSWCEPKHEMRLFPSPRSWAKPCRQRQMLKYRCVMEWRGLRELRAGEDGAACVCVQHQTAEQKLTLR